MIVLGRERSITMDDIKKLYIDEDLTNKGVMNFFNTSLRANRFGMTTTDLDTHFQQGKKAERSALLDFAGMYAAAGLVANYNASGSNFSNVLEGQFKGFNLDKPKVNNSGGSIEGELDVLSKPSSKALRQNMIEAGLDVPDYANAAHHIVAGSSPKAAEARAILQKFGVDINDATNGVFLPTVKNVAEGAYHPSLHTDSYYRKVSDLLSGAKSKNDVLDILDDIADQLSKGTFK
ncbi:AHH domain-containing protein [Paludicola sp. MB14-C6]|uniref:AHH domain-containing protein n=1 Tax=Paludihabitans sp. MB14-C6 TaxID=3070656 RepID=UPI0027DDD979|nr:AHH domain-containing protein [Paludicola sp. MB14-C6]WMJ23153.1 AHH domain-containing protein [Paludicola sp. MB14-C6]